MYHYNTKGIYIVTNKKNGKFYSGENNPTHIYSDEQILKAKKLLDEGMKQIDVAKQLNMGKSTVGRIARGETRKNILD